MPILRGIQARVRPTQSVETATPVVSETPLVPAMIPATSVVAPPVAVVDSASAHDFSARVEPIADDAYIELMPGSALTLGPFIATLSDDNRLAIELRTAPSVGDKANWFVASMRSGSVALNVTVTKEITPSSIVEAPIQAPAEGVEQSVPLTSAEGPPTTSETEPLTETP